MKNSSKTIDYFYLILLSAIWGSSFLFIKIAIETIPPSMLTLFRLTIASMVLIFYIKIISKQKIFIRRGIKEIVFISFVGNVIPFNLISWSEITIESGVASTLIGTMPLFTFMISHFIKKGEKLNMITLVGLLIGFLGICIYFLQGTFNLLSIKGISSFLVLFASICYAFSANFVKKIEHLSSIQVATSSTIYAALFSFPIVLVTILNSEKSFLEIIINFSKNSIFSSLVLGLLCTAIAVIIFFFLIKKQSAVFASQSNFFIPCFGVFWSYIFLDESYQTNLYFSLCLIVIGVYLVHIGRTKRNH